MWVLLYMTFFFLILGKKTSVSCFLTLPLDTSSITSTVKKKTYFCICFSMIFIDCNTFYLYLGVLKLYNTFISKFVKIHVFDYL